MKRINQVIITLVLLCTSIPAFALDAPVLSVSTSGVDVSLSWTSVPGATSYTLHYASNPYTPGDAIGQASMGTDTSFSTTLWDGASYYAGITADDGSLFGESGYSNVELFTIDDTATQQTFEDFTGTFTGAYMSTPFEYIITQSSDNINIIRTTPLATGITYSGTVSENKAIVETLVYGYYGGYSTWTKINDSIIELYLNECKTTPYSTCGAADGFTMTLYKEPPVEPSDTTCAEGGTCVIGDTGPGGGYVFYLNDGSGLEAALTDAGTASWGCANLLIPTGTAIGTGQSNTDAIIANCKGTSAAKLAANYTWPNGQKGGFLPSLEELNELHKYKDVVGSFAIDSYWSSSEDYRNSVWIPILNIQHNPSKYNSRLVRAVRAF